MSYGKVLKLPHGLYYHSLSFYRGNISLYAQWKAESMHEHEGDYKINGFSFSGEQATVWLLYCMCCVAFLDWPPQGHPSYTEGSSAVVTMRSFTLLHLCFIFCANHLSISIKLSLYSSTPSWPQGGLALIFPPLFLSGRINMLGEPPALHIFLTYTHTKNPSINVPDKLVHLQVHSHHDKNCNWHKLSIFYSDIIQQLWLHAKTNILIVICQMAEMIIFGWLHRRRWDKMIVRSFWWHPGLSHRAVWWNEITRCLSLIWIKWLQHIPGQKQQCSNPYEKMFSIVIRWFLRKNKKDCWLFLSRAPGFLQTNQCSLCVSLQSLGLKQTCIWTRHLHFNLQQPCFWFLFPLLET